MRAVSAESSIRIVFLLTLCLGLTACQRQPITYRPQTEQETQDFIAEQQITPVAIQQLPHATFILYEQPDQRTGYWYLSMSSQGHVTSTGSEGGGTFNPVTGQNDPPKLATVLGLPSGRAFVAVIIHDPQAVERVHSGEVVYRMPS
jgi:hypothetical protein